MGRNLRRARQLDRGSPPEWRSDASGTTSAAGTRRLSDPARSPLPLPIGVHVGSEITDELAAKRASRRRRPPAVTIHEVARRAGVSPMTVSRVMNGENYVRAKTREQVLRTIREMEYLPNMAARSLAVAQNTRVALIYANPSMTYLSELLVGVLAKPGKISAQLVIEKWGEIRPAAVRRFARSVAGVVLPPPLSESQMVLSELAAAHTPAVAIAAGRIEARISTVRIDDFRAAGDMTAYLLSLGHRRIGFIKGAVDQTASSERFAGF